MPDEYSAARYTELNRQLAMRERARKREMRGSSAAQGTLYSGHTATQERDIEAQTGEEWHAGSRDIEDRRWRAEQDEIARQHQTGERVGSQEFQTGERTGTQEWASGESEAERNVRMKLQEMSDAERFRLQELVNSGAMDLQEAENKWTSYENDLNRQLETWQTSGQWGHEAGMQSETIAQEQWSAMFGAEAAMALQDDTQNFELWMAKLGRDWELSDRPWLEQMWLMDAQLQMVVAGYDWLDDRYSTGYPAWMVLNPEEGVGLGEGSAYTWSPSSGATSPPPGYTGAPWLDKDGNPTDKQEEAVADNPNYTPPPQQPQPGQLGWTPPGYGGAPPGPWGGA